MSETIVVLHGLARVPELNGSHAAVIGELVDDADADARVPVRVIWPARDDADVLVRRRHLRPRSRFERTPPTLAHCRLPRTLQPVLYEPSRDGHETNLLIVLHGVGDAATNFIEFGRRLQLPQTSLLALTAPMPLPCGISGSSWVATFEDDGSLLERTLKPGDRRRLDGLTRTRSALLELVTVLERCNWRRSELFLLGFSQGADVALDLATRTPAPTLGGVVGLSCACVLAEDRVDREPVGSGPRAATPILTMHGSADDVVTIERAREGAEFLAARLADRSLHTFVELRGAGHSTPRSAEHARPLHAWLAQHLACRSLALEQDADVVELSAGGAS